MMLLQVQQSVNIINDSTQVITNPVTTIGKDSAQMVMNSWSSNLERIDTVCHHVREMLQHMKEVAAYTDPEPLTFFSLHVAVTSAIIAIIGIAISFIAAYYTKKAARFTETTAENVKRVASKTQIKLFEDLIRHLYRNNVCTQATIAKLKEVGYKAHLSEEHILKLKTLTEDIHLENYNDEPEFYSKMHELSFLLRNYNLEIEVVQRYLCNPDTHHKIRELGEDSLTFKPYFIIYKIAQVMNDILKTDNQQQRAIEIVLREHFDKLIDNVDEGEKIRVNETRSERLKKEIEEYKKEIETIEDNNKRKEIEKKITKNEKEIEELIKVKERYDMIKKEIIFNGGHQRSIMMLAKQLIKSENPDDFNLWDGELLDAINDNEKKALEEAEVIREAEVIEPEKKLSEEAIIVESKNVFSDKFKKNLQKRDIIKKHIYYQIYKEDYKEDYKKAYPENKYIIFWNERIRKYTSRPKGLDSENIYKFNMKWNAFDLLHKALIKDVMIEYNRIHIVPLEEFKETGNNKSTKDITIERESSGKNDEDNKK